MRILLVEDEEKVARFIERGLVAERFAVDVADDGVAGLELARTYNYDLMILDLLLPRMEGTEVLRRVRLSNPNIPILILTARDTVADKVENFEAGTDDYLTKPFAFAELLVRIKALLRRGPVTRSSVLRVGDLELDRLSQQVKRSGKRIELTSKVFKRYKGRRIKDGHPEWARAKWWMEFSLGGHYVFRPIRDVSTRSQAKRAEIGVRESIYNGRFNPSTEQFSNFVDNIYLPWARNNKKSFAHDESRAKPLKGFFGTLELRKIPPMLIEEFKISMKGKTTQRGTDRKGVTVNRYLQLLSKVFSMAYDNGLVDSNPCKRVLKEKEGGRRERYLTHQEEGRLMEVLKGDLSHLAPAVTLALRTGMRKAELLGLRFEHINFGE